MQRVFLFQKEDNELDGIHIDNVGKKILKEHLLTRKTASFEWYPDFDLCSFNWYDINSPETDTERILIYFSRKDLLVYCENADTQVRMTNFFFSEVKTKILNGSSMIFSSDCLHAIWIILTIMKILLLIQKILVSPHTARTIC